MEEKSNAVDDNMRASHLVSIHRIAPVAEMASEILSRLYQVSYMNYKCGRCGRPVCPPFDKTCSYCGGSSFSQCNLAAYNWVVVIGIIILAIGILWGAIHLWGWLWHINPVLDILGVIGLLFLWAIL
jgi:hypothetical protein